MGRQINFFATLQDQTDMCKILTNAGAIPTDGYNATILDLDSVLKDDSIGMFFFALPQSYLQTEDSPRPSIPFETAPRGPVTDSVTGFSSSRYFPSSSDLIEFIKCPRQKNVPVIKEIVAPGRIWYPTGYKIWIGNNEEVIKKLFNKVKYFIRKNFIYNKTDSYYIGPDAYDKWKKGDIFLAYTCGFPQNHTTGIDEALKKKHGIRFNL